MLTPNIDLSKTGKMPGIDFFKLVFTLLIPLLHINHGGGPVIVFFEQYIARLGVPFFFCCTGFFLEGSIKKTGVRQACRKYCVRSLWLLCFWLPFVLPFYIKGSFGHFILTFNELMIAIQTILFLTPGYLWYLSAGVLGIIIHCFFRNIFKDNLLVPLIICTVLYAVGCLGNTYSFSGIVPQWYYDIFLSTRNGLFFAAPLITLGAWIRSRPFEKMKYGIPAALAIYITEVYLIRSTVAPNTDTSMYFSIPLIIYCLMIIAIDIRTSARVSNFLSNTRQWGILFYCMQYPCFTAAKHFTKSMTSAVYILLFDYTLLIALSLLAFLIIKKSKIKILSKLI